MISARFGRVWEESDSPHAADLAREYQALWKDSPPGRRPDPHRFWADGDSAAPAGALLAVLRADMALRRGDGQPARAEWYQDHVPDLTGEMFVALLYEEYCLRAEAGERADQSEYLGRYPEHAERLRELFEIHDLIASRPSTLPYESPAGPVAFPRTGQTIDGYLLEDELGRGSFARVFLARERQLADRPVALKVTRVGSREPQTLARLQHTHIVPVYSYRTDPATGFHLLCMPYYGRATLARLLEEPALGAPRAGQDLLAALDRLDPADGPAVGHQAARAALARRPYPRAIAWWGARMAEALHHAHDLGVLHRDIKPSNILIASDGTPMLLDFNLAYESWRDGQGSATLGGTIAYMAPEHYQAMTLGSGRGIDHRADIYSLGMVLLEMLEPMQAEGTPPSPGRPDADGPRGRIARAAAADGVPPALVAVIRRCLESSREDRYASASDLAADLQAVADDAPLAFAREPWPPRAARWLRRHALHLAIAVPLAVAVPAAVAARFQDQARSLRLEAEVREEIRDAEQSEAAGDLPTAIGQYIAAIARAEGHPELAALRDRAERGRESAEAARQARRRADRFFDRAESLRFALLGFVGDQADASRDLADSLRPFGILGADDWAQTPAVRLLDEGRRARLLREADDLLFSWVVAVALGRPGAAGGAGPDGVAKAYCRRALGFTGQPGPWIALHDWWAGRGGAGPAGPILPDPSDDVPAAGCFRWYLLGKLGPDRDQSLAWLERAARREPGNYWHHFALAYEWARAGRDDRALTAYGTAIALRPDVPWAWKNRAVVSARRGEWASAVADLAEALRACRAPIDAARVRLEMGRTGQRLGRFRAARADYAAALAGDPAGEVAREARRDLARLEADSGRPGRARAIYDELVSADPDDRRSRWGRARLALRLGRPDLAGPDLDALIASTPAPLRAPYLADRAMAWLAEGRAERAEEAATLAARLDPNPHHARLRDRARVALGRDLDPWPDRPDAFDGFPFGGPALRQSLREAAGRLGDGRDADPTRAVLLSAAGDHAGALALAERRVAEAPGCVDARLALARIARRAGRADLALSAIAGGLAIEPDAPDLMELHGSIRVAQGDAAGGLSDLAAAAARGSDSAEGADMARALAALGRHAEAADLWSALVEADPFDARAALGLAAARRSLGQWERAVVALESAASTVEPGSPLLGRVALGYAACLPARPGRVGRVLALVRRLAEERPRPGLG
ncbi:protein kinase domain-containing protein [Tundrisphaera sp. TA3]|uniref:protein kinase domain-containing protein n=1 Tax=Tundrisphaera sp. TA3 TaxID=3435775 RepID=UPI003EB69EFB